MKRMQRMKVVGHLVSTLVILGLLGCGTSGQDGRSTTTTVSGGSFVADEADIGGEVTDEEVRDFARAYIEVMAVQQQYYPRVQQAVEAEREALMQESEARIEEIIVARGLTTSRFNAIVVRVPSDDDLRRRVQVEIQSQEEERLRELRESEGL